jgi:hypothetical protein
MTLVSELLLEGLKFFTLVIEEGLSIITVWHTFFVVELELGYFFLKLTCLYFIHLRVLRLKCLRRRLICLRLLLLLGDSFYFLT